MEKSFANLLRHSRLASYDRTLEQVYHSPQTYRKIGDWGLKRNLPTVIKAKNVIIEALDTTEHQTPWKSGNDKVLFVKRWRENFPNSRKPTPRNEEVEYNVANMTPIEFKRFIRESKRKAGDFQEKIAKKELLPEQVFDYLHANFAETTKEKGGGVVGPDYSEYHAGWDYPVHGRILNADYGGYAVGIGGIVALLSKRDAVGLVLTDRKVVTVHVHNAEIDEQGKPKVEVTLRRKGAASSIPLLNDYEGYGRPDKMMNPYGGQRRRQAARSTPQPDEKVRPNSQHNHLMDRISDLLNNKN
ncbi:uncharacterized protein BX663DRAFT_532430 [Cokeromyces recurvatus]|uniref:uncharacterized protein n=1 Tax=Cokeromyces recurvatus TaxID=90255 RepID=UPI00221E74CB|nr:uncharacterized protein BX663DRAFT_532430 [Cokeromyces recurvatus]KAI7900292.1 hypothetical protein BX663DRAFT_532430 [Cokeromyces recurvatus]